MFKKIIYIISVILGVFFVSKLFKEGSVSFDYPKPSKEPQHKKDDVKRIDTKDLNNRQKDILKLLNKREILLPSDIYALHPNVSTRTLRRDMTSLVEKNLVRQEGSTRDTKYILNS